MFTENLALSPTSKRCKIYRYGNRAFFSFEDLMEIPKLTKKLNINDFTKYIHFNFRME